MTKLKINFSISEDIVTKCLDFANKSIESSADKYARRNQFNAEKIIKDIMGGKIGEEIVYQSISEVYPDLTKPDYNIYDKKNKSWNPDLKDDVSEIRVGVKSQNIDSRIAYGESWVFQYGFGGKYDCDTGVFKSKNDKYYISFVALNIPKRTAEIRGIVKIQWLHDEKLFKPMKLVKLQGNKVAVYFSDLEKYNKEELYQL